MRTVVDAPQAARVDMAVDLRCRERRVPQQFLDHAQVGSTLEQMRRECVAQPMWVTEEPSHGARVEPTSARR